VLAPPSNLNVDLLFMDQIFRLTIVVLLLLVEYSFAQLAIPKTTRPPIVDGRVDDGVWNSGALINEFFQREPFEGEPLSEKTEVFILYDADHIYFGIKCYQDPESIAAKEMLRSAPLPNDDRVHIVLDTFLDGRNAYIFEINPLGSIGEAFISENGRQVNRSWQGLFVGKSSINQNGWEAELAIPFKTLSFDAKKDSWGLFMNRMIESKQEWGSWPVANLNAAEYAVSDAGVISGLHDITQGIGLDITPYALAGVDSKKDSKSKSQFNAGSDLYYQITPSLKASLSFNTDFAEIEADARQINLSRFNIRLSEKRNFFLDGADLFGFGLEGRRTEPPSGKLTPFFSRRIGLNAQGRPIPIHFAAKVTGRINNWNVGLLHVNEDRSIGQNNSSVARVSYNLGQHSSVGMMTTFGNAQSEAYNLVTGLDVNLATAKFAGDQYAALKLFGIRSKTEDISGNDAAWGALFNFPNDLLNLQLGHQQIGENFYTGLGFVPRTNIKESWGHFSIGPRLNRLGIRQYSAGASLNYVTDFDDNIESQSLEIEPVGIRFNSGEEFQYSLAFISEYLDNDFNIYSDFIIPADEYHWWENQFSFETSGSRDVFAELRYTVGDFFTGRKNSVDLELNWKVFVPLFLGGSVAIDRVQLPEGDFSANIFQLNVNILFSPDISLYNYLQYDSQSNTAGLQTRFRWIVQPGNEVLFVWNSGYSRPDTYYVMNESAVRFKVKYNIRF
jgi:hypothetical protein